MPEPKIPTGGGDEWTGRFKSGMNRAAQSRDAFESKQSDSATSTESVVATPAPAPAPAVVAPVSTTTVVPATSPATAPVAEQPVAPVQTTEPRVLKVSDDNLIEIPGEKAMSARQIKAQIHRVRDLQQKESELNKWENELRTRSAQPAPAPVEVPKSQPVTPQLTAPVKPDGVLPGDPEYDKYLIELGAHEAYKRINPALESMQKDLRDRSERENMERQTQATYRANIEHNQMVHKRGLELLPFDIGSISEESAEAVYARIQDVAAPIIDFRNGAHVRQVSPAEMQLIINAAFPPGTAPPGYVFEEPEAITTLREQSGPVVDPAKPQPMSAPSLSSVNQPQKAAKAMPNQGRQSWEQRMESTFKGIGA